MRSEIMNAARTSDKQKLWKPADFVRKQRAKRKPKRGQIDPVFSRLDAYNSLRFPQQNG